ncbi:hypothetical protein [Paenibacillus sp. USHLN196]|uniref:hypothetical protein n=1 Tax=Paenibacillus sp. USHLN196 TaxID=3081291 RepID=UPI003016436F
MYYVGMRSIDTLDVVEILVYNDEIKEILEYFYGEYYSLVFVIEGQDVYIKDLYREPIGSLLSQWTEEVDRRADDKKEYEHFLIRLGDLIK